MLKVIHPIAGMIAILTIATFWLSTVLSELFASEATVVAVKTAVPWGFLLLVPALAATGGSGFVWSKGQRTGPIGAKLKRMPFIAGNGLLILIPSALFLASKARAGAFDTGFYVVQGIELIAGATNIALLGLGMRDGLAVTKWRRGSFLRPGKGFSTRLLSREDVAKGTAAFHLQKPDGFTFRAGQAIYVTLDKALPTDAKGRVRTFTIASAPHDPDLVVATRLTDTSFKRDLAGLPPHAAIEIEGPYGDLSLHEDASRPAVFLAGGIGVTPFRSMIRDATQRALPHPLYLFYSNRSASDAAFLDELRALENQNPRFRLIATMTDDETWSRERGFIAHDVIAKHVGEVAKPVYYVAGPPAMVTSMEKLLEDAGIEAEDVRVEQFAGY